MAKYNRNKVQELLKEQTRLVKVENILTKLLGQVNESINELKVEELHIKSSLIEHYTNSNDEEPSTSAQAALRLKSNNHTDISSFNIYKSQNSIDTEGIEDINKQILELESLLVPIKQKSFNEQEEEDDDDDYEPTENSESDEEEEDCGIKKRLK